MRSPSEPAEIGNRIAEARRSAEGVTQMTIAHSIGKGESTIRNYENGKSTPVASDLPKIAAHLGVDVHWLLTGERSIFTGDMHSSHLGGDSYPLTKSDGVSAHELARYADRFTLTVYTHLHASAGPPDLYSWEPTDEDDYIRVTEGRQIFADLLGFYPPDDMDAVRVRGTSGRRPVGGIEDGQVILYVPVRGSDDVIDGRRYVLTVSEGDQARLLVKRVQRFTGGGIKLVSDNPYSGVEDELLLPGDDCLIHSVTKQPVHIQFVGRVIWPTEIDTEQTRSVISGTLEELILRGFLPTTPTG